MSATPPPMGQDDHDLLVRISEQIKALAARFEDANLRNHEQHRQNTDRLASLDSRLRKLEEWRWSWLGAMALLVFLISWLSHVLVK